MDAGVGEYVGGAFGNGKYIECSDTMKFEVNIDECPDAADDIVVNNAADVEKENVGGANTLLQDAVHCGGGPLLAEQMWKIGMKKLVQRHHRLPGGRGAGARTK